MSEEALSVQLIGVAELDSTLASAQQMNDIIDTIRRNTTAMWRLTKLLAPVDTGFLRDHVEMSLLPMEGTVASTADYAIWQEIGTRYQAGTPHVTPAFEVQSKVFISDVERIMR